MTQIRRPRNAPERVTQSLLPNVTIDGEWLWYKPTFFPSHDVKEWGGSWNKDKQAWRLPILRVNIDRISSFDSKATFSEQVQRWIDFDYSSPGEINWELHPHAERLYPFQREAVKRIVYTKMHGQHCTLSPGLGKTPTSIVAAEILASDTTSQILVVAPLSLLRNWEREIQRWSKWQDVAIDNTHKQTPTDARWIITNYDTIRIKTEAYAQHKFDVVICDESVLLKNRKAKRTQAVAQVCKNAGKTIMLSGAPTVRNNSDIWSQWNILQPEYFRSFWRFTHDTCIIDRTDFGTLIVSSRHNVDLKHDYRELMFVRNQEQVLPDLPEIRYQDIEVELTPRQRRMHEQLMSTWLAKLDENSDNIVEVTIVLSELIRLQQITSNLRNCESINDALAAKKIPRLAEWPDESGKADIIVDLLGNGEVELPCLVWVHWRYGAMALYDRLERETRNKDSALFERRVEVVLGDTKNKDAIIEEYKNGKIDVLILSLGVGKYGHTLVNTRTIIYHDKSWDSDAYFQSQYRVRRNGLTHSPHCISLRARNSIDEFVELNLAGKLPSMASVTGSDLAKLLRSLGEEYPNE